MEEVKKRQNKGKRKIPIEPITNKTKKQVTFSKRRVGLIKKGSELCSLCGANLAIITFSGAGKLFGFGHPSAEAVIQRYVNNDCFIRDDSNTNNNVFGNKIQQYKGVIGQIESEKKANTLSNVANISNNVNNNNNNGGFWWDEVNVDKLGLVELEQFKLTLECLRNEVASRVDNEISRSSTSFVPQNIDFAHRNGNIVAQCQGSDGCSKYWTDHSTVCQNNFCQQESLPPVNYTFRDYMATKKGSPPPVNYTFHDYMVAKKES